MISSSPCAKLITRRHPPDEITPGCGSEEFKILRTLPVAGICDDAGMKTPVFCTILLTAASLHAGDPTTTVAIQQALATPHDGVSRQQVVNNFSSGNGFATVNTDGRGNAVIIAPREVIYVQPSPLGGVNMFSTGPDRPACPVECP